MTQSIDRIDFLTREVLNHLGDGWIKGVIVRQDINNLVIEARALRDQLSKERAEANYWANEQAKTLNALADRNAGLSSELSKSNCNYLLIVEQLEKEREMRKELVENAIATLCSKFPEYGNREFSVREIRALLEPLKATELDKK